MRNHQYKAQIQRKIDKIIRREFLSPCPDFLDKTAKFNEKLINTISSKNYCKRNACNSFNFHHSVDNKSDLKYINEVNTYLNDPAHLFKVLNQQFTTEELKHLIINIDVFIKNEKIKKYFPKIKALSIEDKFIKEEKEPPNYLKEKKMGLPMIVPYDMKDQVQPGLTGNIQKVIMRKFFCERDKLHQKKENQKENELVLRKIILEMNHRFVNIKKELNHFKHPLLEYYLKKKPKKIISRQTSCGYFRASVGKYKELHERNKSEIQFLEKIKDNLYKKRKNIHRLEKEEDDY